MIAPGRTPRLIVVNGAPGVGKTTIATRYADQHPMTLRIDVDEIRELISGWESDPLEAGRSARLIVCEMARRYLMLGKSVIVSQLYGRINDLEELEQIVAGLDCEFVEIVLVAPREEARKRFMRRAGPKLDATTDVGGAPDFDELCDRVVDVSRRRPEAKLVYAIDGDVSGTVAAVIAEIDRST